MKMPGGMLVFRAVATTYMAALQAQPEMHPRISTLKTLGATIGARLHLADLIQMRAFPHRATSP